VYEGNLTQHIPENNSYWESFTNKGIDDLGRTAVEFVLKGTFRSNEVMQKWMELGQLYSVNEIIPSMNDIFISLVKNVSDE